MLVDVSLIEVLIVQIFIFLRPSFSTGRPSVQRSIGPCGQIGRRRESHRGEFEKEYFYLCIAYFLFLKNWIIDGF